MKKLIVSSLALGILVVGLGNAAYAQNNGDKVKNNCCKVECSNGCCQSVDCTKTQD